MPLNFSSGNNIGDPIIGGTAGSVLFVDASGNLGQDNTNLYWNDTSNYLRVPEIDGSDSASGTLTLQSTSHATKGKILFGTSAYDEVNNRLGIATATPLALFHVNGTPGNINQGIVFGDGDSGIYEDSDDALVIALAAGTQWYISDSSFGSSLGAGGGIRNASATATNPTLIPYRGDTNTGFGWAGADLLTLIAGGVEGLRIAGDGQHIMSSTLDAATGNEIAYQLNYTTNKSSSGNDTGLQINMTDTASPGTSWLADFQVGGTTQLSITNAGQIRFGAGTGKIDAAGNDIYIDALNAAGDIIFRAGGETERARISPEGKWTTSNLNLDDATGNEIAYTLNYTTNKLTSGNDTGLQINQTDTASPGSSYLLDLKVGGTSKFYVSNSGTVVDNGSFYVSSIEPITSATSLLLNQTGNYTAANKTGITMLSGVNFTQTSGTNYGIQITPTYNQASGTAANTDLLINRTQTAVGSGAQLLIDAQVSTASKFSVDNTGIGLFASHLKAVGNVYTDTLLSYTAANTLIIQGRQATTAGDNVKCQTALSYTNTSGSSNFFSITPTYNQASGTAANTDLYVSRTETAVGSGQQNLFNFLNGAQSRFRGTNNGLLAIRTLATVGNEAINIEQNDVDMAFIDYSGTSSADLANNISTFTTEGGTVNYVKIEINGAAFWFRACTAPTA